ncbi:MAG TPA: AAA family ATPase [Candidatus Eremiobacteraceae bacterium]|nr:AAA family ATPase [Candidatus Eremiobacteraceae bacterium]
MSISQLTTLGRFSFQVDGKVNPGPATRKARALMTYLAMNRNVEAARERLIQLFWPDADPEHARDSLKTALWSIRRCLRVAGVDDEDYLKATKSTVLWSGETTVDAIELARLARTNDAIGPAIEAFGGDFLEGDYDNWTIAERERLSLLYESVLARAVKSSRDVEAAQLFIARNPYSEDAYATLIEAELAAGRQAAALSWVERCRAALKEVGEEPSEAFLSRFGGLRMLEPVGDGPTLPFTGRTSELSVLSARAADTLKDRGSITIVHGEAGVGKSTLVTRFSDAASRDGISVLYVRCGGEAQEPFHPWAGVYRDLRGADFQDFARTHAADIAAALADAILGEIVPSCIVVIDDAHMLSGDALKIFAALAQRARSRRAVVVATRPEGLPTLRTTLEALQPDELALGCLERAALEPALAEALRNDETDLFEVLYQRSGGHPLFFIGLLNDLVDQGALARAGRMWRLIRQIDVNAELPDTVKRYVEIRLQAKGETPRRVACALALEPAASADDLAFALGLSEDDILDALDDLLALGVIVQPPTGMAFVFSHDLIRDVAVMELNAGRRVQLHRVFASRLVAGDREAALRRARHLESAGEHLAAARSYLGAAESALEIGASQDAIDRADAGIREAERLEKSEERDVVLARLVRLGARAAFAAGEVHAAIARARQATAAARSAGDRAELSRSMLDLAAIEGSAFLIEAQKSDASEAARVAATRADRTVEAQALVQMAAAARALGQQAEALRIAREARDLTRRSAIPDEQVAALDELLRNCLTWWRFDEALETARELTGIVHLASQVTQAKAHEGLCALEYLMDRFDDALVEHRASLDALSAESSGLHDAARSPESGFVTLFMNHRMAAKIACERAQWSQAVSTLHAATEIASVAALPRYSHALSLQRIDLLLLRDYPGDIGDAGGLLPSLDDSPFQDLVGWSDCSALARARVAARERSGGASNLLRRALNALEENARRTPLDADRAFGRLADAAREVGELAIAERARQRAVYYASVRRAAAERALAVTLPESRR